MNKIDRNLIDGKGLSSANKDDFKEYINSQIKLDKPVGFNEFITRAYVITLLIISSIVAIIVGVLILKNILILGFILLLMGVIFIFFVIHAFKTRKKFFNNAFSNIDILDITKKWFSYYDVKDKDVSNSSFADIDKYISKHRMSPDDASVTSSTKPFSIVNNNIETTFILVVWYWTRSDVDSDGNHTTRSYYLNQFYSFDRNFNEKWNKFEFSLIKGKTIFKRKAETLENTEFNKAFKYKYNDPIKLRQAFTPSVQENILNKFCIKDISIVKIGDVLITTSTQSAVGGGFTPFTINPGSAVLDEEVIKKKLFNDLYEDFRLLMVFMGHPRLIYSLYRK